LRRHEINPATNSISRIAEYAKLGLEEPIGMVERSARETGLISVNMPDFVIVTARDSKASKSA
jgi:hypothetical protein